MYRSYQGVNKYNQKFVIWLVQIRFFSKGSVLYKKQLDYYDVLGVTRKANAKDLKVAYYKKCKQFHPDRNKSDPKAHQKFIALNQAYTTLSDSNLRKKYDQVDNNTTSYSNPANPYPHHYNSEYYTRYSQYHDYYTDRMRDEKMRYDSHNRKFYYQSSNAYARSSTDDFRTPVHVVFGVMCIVITIFMFDALFINYTYQNDMNRMHEYYAPMNKITQRELKARMERKLTKEDENEIDEQIRINREYEEMPRIHVNKSPQVEIQKSS